MPKAQSVVGRDAELGRLETALEAGAGAVVTGSAGTGKTRLVAEFLRRATEQGYPARSVAATGSLAAVPLGAFATLLPADEAPAVAPTELLGRAVAAVRSIGVDRPPLLAVDDAHLLDEMSAGLVQLLVSARAAFVVATLRAGEPEPESIRALWRDERIVHLRLGPLERSAADQLVAAEFGGQVDGPTLQRLWDVTQGNPLFIRELVAVGRERGFAVRTSGVWSWRGELALSDRLSRLLAERLDGLAEDERAALELIALGEPIGPELLYHRADDRVLERLEARGLITSVVEGRRHQLRLAHPLYAEGLRLAVPPLRRRGAYRVLAGALAATGARRKEDALQLALWQLDAGTARDPDQLAAAARQALGRFDHALCERFARAAQLAGPSVLAALTLVQSLHWQGRYQEAGKVLQGLDGPGSEPAQLAEIARLGGDNLLFGQGDSDAAIALLEDAERRLAGRRERLRLAAHRATFEFCVGRPAMAVRITDEVLASRVDDPETRMRALFIRLPALALTGRIGRALEAAAEGMALIAGFPLGPLVGANLTGSRVVAQRLAGRLDDADELSAADRTGNEGWWPLVAGQVAIDRGRVGSAMRLLREAVALLEREDVNRMLRWAVADLARAAAIAGDASSAARALTVAEEHDVAANRWLNPEVLRAQAWAAAASGDVAGARRLARAAATDASAKGQAVFELVALHDALRLGDHQVAARIVRVAAAVDGRAAPAYAAHATAVAVGDAGAVYQAASRFAGLGMMLLAAEAACQAANLYRAADERATAQASAVSAQRWLDSCEGARTPALAELIGAHPLAGLTSRERELAELAARLSSREIAERLTLSVRTVDNHLARVYQKLQISGRGELATLIDHEVYDERRPRR